MRYGFGVDLGGTTVKIAYFDEEGTLLKKWAIPTITENGGSRILPDIAASIEDFITREAVDRSTLLGIGIGVPGPVNDQGIVNKCVNLGWGRCDVAGELSGLTGLPVKAGNDATVAALGESWKGSGSGCQNVVFVTLGTGVGGGIIVHGQPIHGTHGAGGEIGHMNVNPAEQETCNCGRHGCVEQYCSATGVVRLAKRHLAASCAPSLLRELGDFACKDVFQAAAQSDALAQETLEEVYNYMGLFLATLCTVLDPEAVVIGGGVSMAGQPLLDGIRKAFDKYVFHAASQVEFRLASLLNDAGAYGAFKLILN